MKTKKENLEEKTKKESFELIDLNGVMLENGQTVPFAAMVKFWKHQIKSLKVVYKVQATEYFVMRNSQPE